MTASPRRDACAPPRYESLDAWRGIACLAVVVGHAAGLLRRHPAAADATVAEMATRGVLGFGWAGVPVFFVISGYCIAAAAHAARQRGDEPADFFRRRFRRIFPPYWCCLAITALVGTLLGMIAPGLVADPRHEAVLPASIPAIHWLGNVTLTEIWLGHLTGAPFQWRNMVVAPAWTLCYEEQFYAVVGLLAWLAGPRLGTALAAVTAIVLARVILQPVNLNSGFFFDGRWLFFAAGLAVWFDVARPRGATRWLTRGYLAAGIAWAIRDPGAYLTRAHGVEHEWLVSFLFAALLLAFHPFDRSVADRPVARLLAACGRRCYSVYLVHWMLVRPITLGFEQAGWTSLAVTLVATIPLCVAASLVAGWIFHRLVERRFLGGAATPRRIPIPVPPRPASCASPSFPVAS